MWEVVFLALLHLVGFILFFCGKVSGPFQVWSGWNSHPSTMQILHKETPLEQGSADGVKMNKRAVTLRDEMNE